MKVKIMVHYALSFFIAALFLVVVNVLYMQSTVYKDDELYNFDPQAYFQDIINKLSFNEDIIKSDSDLESYLNFNKLGLQVLNDDLFSIYERNDLKDLLKAYTPQDLIEVYEDDSKTTFIKTLEVENNVYTLLLFMDPALVSRTLYSYDSQKVQSAYNPMWLIGMNLILLLMISYMYTYSISRPIHRINAGILKLSHGDYELENPSKGIYKEIEIAMTDLAKALKEADQVQALTESSRQAWISNLSHDIKTPLTSIMGYGELLGDPEDRLTDEEKVHYRNIITEKGLYIEMLLEDLNLTTRLKHGQVPLKLEKVNLVSEVKILLIDTLNDTSDINQVEFSHTDESIDIHIDRRLFKRVFINLMHNAFVHNPQGVLVKVHMEDQDTEYIKIILEDNGVGIPEEELKTIFTRYYRGSHTKIKTEGSGLGLAISKDIIEAHGGRISAENSSLGGLKITIYLRRKIHEALS